MVRDAGGDGEAAGRQVGGGDGDGDVTGRSTVARMQRDDRAGPMLGIEIVAVDEGTATVRMTVRADMVNGHGICHGGLIFTLADTAMAYASNSHGPDAVAAAASIDFVSPARLGSTLTATAVEGSLRGRTGLYDVTVTDDAGNLVARFHGRTQTIAMRPSSPGS